MTVPIPVDASILTDARVFAQVRARIDAEVRARIDAEVRGALVEAFHQFARRNP